MESRERLKRLAHEFQHHFPFTILASLLSLILLALYTEGDEESKGAAARFVDAAIQLRRAAASHRLEIHKHNYPTIFHEFGALIGTVEPRISETWLSELLYLSQEGRLQRITERLPDDVRHAAHNYLAARDELRSLESGGRGQEAAVRS